MHDGVSRGAHGARFLLAVALLAPWGLDAQKPAAGTAAKTPARPAVRQAAKPAAKSGVRPSAAQAATPVARPATPPVPAPAPKPVVLPSDALRAGRSVAVREGPGGRTLATLAEGSVVTPVAREGAWVKVRLEAWVEERELQPADSALRGSLSAADLRADPDAVRGRLVRWEVQHLAFQRADGLRRELAPEEPYLLARGPGTEDAMLYLALPPSLVEAARGLAPLTRVLVTARVRSGRSAPVGIPILDVLALVPLKRS